MTEGDRCSVDGCERQARTRGLCGMHYSRTMRGGSPGPPQPRPRKGIRVAFSPRTAPPDPPSDADRQRREARQRIEAREDAARLVRELEW